MKKAFLAAACVLLAPMFLVTVSSSATYDPWSDLDADGDIDIFDMVKIASAYGSTGDPTKEVTIAGRGSRLLYTDDTTIGSGGVYYSPWISVDGYSRVTVSIYQGAGDNSYRLDTRYVGFDWYFIVELLGNAGYHLVKTYDVPNEEIRVFFYNGDSTARGFYIAVYAIP